MTKNQTTHTNREIAPIFALYQRYAISARDPFYCVDIYLGGPSDQLNVFLCFGLKAAFIENVAAHFLQLLPRFWQFFSYKQGILIIK